MIGCGGKGRDDARLAAEHGDFVAVCDVDRRRAERYAANPELNGNGKRKLDIDSGHLTATCYLGKGSAGGPFDVKPVPEGLDWDRWLGQTPMVDHLPQRGHGSFR